MKIYSYVIFLLASVCLAGAASQRTTSGDVTPRTRSADAANTLRRLRQINRHHRRRQGNRRRQGRRRVTTPASTTPAVTAPPTLSRQQYQARIRNKQARLFIIQQNILNQLGMNQQPNVTRPPLSPEAEQEMINYYNGKNQQSRTGVPAGRNQEFFASVESPHPSCDKPPRWDSSKWRSSNGYRLYFNIKPTGNDKARVASAFLKIYKKKVLENDVTPTPSRARATPRRQLAAARSLRRTGRGVTVRADIDLGDSSKIRVSVFQYLRPVRRRGPVRKRLLDSVMVARSYQGPLKLDLRAAATEWLRRPTKNFGVELEVEDSLQKKMDPTQLFEGHECSTQSQASTTTASTVENSTDPTLLLTTEVPVDAATRAKRGAKIERESTCKEETMHIDFRQIGWSDWVLQPVGFSTKYCHGECPGLPLDSNFMLPGMACCSPIETKSLSLLYVDHKDRIVLARMENIIVTKCGCRT